MLQLEYKTTEMTVQELATVERCAERSSVLDMVSFVMIRAANIDDTDQARQDLAAVLFRLRASELRRHFNEALCAAMPATADACRAVDEEFKERRAVHSDGLDDLFPADMALPDQQNGSNPR